MPDSGSLGEKGRGTFPFVGGAATDAEERSFKAERLLQRQIVAAIDGFQCVANGEWRHAGNDASDGFSARKQLIGSDNFIDETDTQTVGSGINFSSQNHLQGDALADKTRETLGAAVTRDQAELHFRLTHFGVVTGDAEGAGEGELAAAAESKSIDAGNDGFAAGFNGAKDSLTAQGEIATFDTVDLGELLNVGTGGKSFFARTGEDSDANGIVGLDGVDGGLQLAQSGGVERVQNFGTVEGEKSDAVANFELNIFQCFFWRHNLSRTLSIEPSQSNGWKTGVFIYLR